MRVVICDDPATATSRVVARIADLVRARPQAVLGLATGGTMERVYAALIAAHREDLSFARATSFNLDEYVGLSPDHPQSYRSYMQSHFFDEVDFDPARTFIPEGDRDPAESATRYEAQIAALGPIDLQLLGLGQNGHIGFNEPASSLASRTREKMLTQSTRDANARFFADDEVVPHSAVTMGIGTILDARAIVVLALGAQKAAAVRATIEGPLTAFVPASALQMHPAVTFVVDAAAAAALTLQEHYRAEEALQLVREGT